MSVNEEFAEFVGRRGPALLRAAYVLTGDEHAAHDLVQIALAKAFVRWRQIQFGPESYVRQVMYNSHISSWRRIRRHEVTVADVPEGLAVPVDGPVSTDTATELVIRLLAIDQC